ncbi:microfibril-associated glycoprotein 4-like [Mercenaria mercenaria]|uniref:microfibril-associated glycoprotein 4-like n=1 Tax=Mercenaria mercenaria TaxID=6596 RepID=UPI00234F785A|nr:microfibril-associated glycoprotein 4-like [Mercenaria mercenaria]
MYLKILAVTVFWTGVISGEDLQHYCNPVINILRENDRGSESVHVSTEFQSEQVWQMFTNVSRTLLDEYELRFVAFLNTLDVTSRPIDCQDIKALGHRRSGVYYIYPKNTRGFSVRCDMDTANGGWTLIQRRILNSDFYKTWDDYQFGFGNLSENFWIGNQQIHLISTQGWYELRVDMTSMDNETAYAEYKLFSVGDVDSLYKLTVAGYSGTAGDSLTVHNNRKFSTKDRDYDTSSGNCARMYSGAWWYADCHASNLNGDYGNKAYAKGPVWHTWKGLYSPLKTTEMKIRRWQQSETLVSVDP